MPVSSRTSFTAISLALVVNIGTLSPPWVEAMRLAEIYRARVLDATTGSFVFELTGSTEKVNTFVDLMREVGLVEVARTGVVAISRGREAI